MNKQPEALRLADWCDANSSGIYRPSAEAAAELRRLVAENKVLHQRHHDDNVEYTRVLAQRDQLLKALKKLEYSSDGCIKRYPEESEVNAAIKAVEEHPST